MAKQQINPLQEKNLPAFRATRSTAFSTTAGSTVTMVFNNELYDYDSSYDTTNGRFTAKVAGVYHFSTSIVMGSASTALLIVLLRRNGTEDTRGTDWRNASSNKVGTANGDIYLAVGDYVDVGVHCDIVSSLDVTTSQINTTFSGHLVRAA